MKQRRWLRRSILALVIALLAIQLVPYGRDHHNPPPVREPEWDRAETRELARRACFDCHSHETRWPWYASVAPVSWLVQRDVDEGRRELNFSRWDRPQKEAHEAAESVEKDEMPLWFYTPLHPEAKLTPAEKDDLARGLQATMGSSRRDARK